MEEAFSEMSGFFKWALCALIFGLFLVFGIVFWLGFNKGWNDSYNHDVYILHGESPEEANVGYTNCARDLKMSAERNSEMRKKLTNTQTQR